MSDKWPVMSLAEAMAVVSEFGPVAYKSKMLVNILHRARKVVKDEAERVMKEQSNGICTTCWGDGFHRTRPEILSGACPACQGTGRQPITTP